MPSIFAYDGYDGYRELQWIDDHPPWHVSRWRWSRPPPNSGLGATIYQVPAQFPVAHHFPHEIISATAEIWPGRSSCSEKHMTSHDASCYFENAFNNAHVFFHHTSDEKTPFLQRLGRYFRSNFGADFCFARLPWEDLLISCCVILRS